MNTLYRNVAAVLLGFIVGSLVNMAIITVSPHVIPPPTGVDVTKVESMQASMHLFEAKHFLFPFLAHALGALVGSLLAFVAAGARRAAMAYTVSALFLAGGIAACLMIPAPTWFKVIDLVFAYLPMAWLGTRLGGRFTAGAAPAA
jgi:hypothetical protein